jgi:hypothetical protein
LKEGIVLIVICAEKSSLAKAIATALKAGSRIAHPLVKNSKKHIMPYQIYPDDPSVSIDNKRKNVYNDTASTFGAENI